MTQALQIPEGLTAAFEYITPETARQWYDDSEEMRLRTVTGPRAHRYAEMMAQGKWKPTGQGISLDSEGLVLDGHGRLAAIARGDKPILCLVARGVSRDAIFVMDEGKRRLLQDFLHIPHATPTASVLRLLFDYKNDQLGQLPVTGRGKDRIPTKLILGIEAGITLHRSVAKPLASALARTNGMSRSIRGVAPEALITMMGFLGDEKLGQEFTDDWFLQVSEGHDLAETDPACRLREGYFQSVRAFGAKSATSSKRRSARYIMAWNAHVRDLPMPKWALHWKETGPKKQPFPTPIFSEDE